MAELKQRYAELCRKESAQVLAKLFGTAGILRKYRMINEAKKAIGLSRDALKRCEKCVVTIIKPEPVILRQRALDKNLSELLKSFYLRDVSCATAGKKETVTRMKVKKTEKVSPRTTMQESQGIPTRTSKGSNITCSIQKTATFLGCPTANPGQ